MGGGLFLGDYGRQNSNSSSAEVCQGVLGSCSIDFFPNTKHLSAVEKSAFTNIVGKAAGDIHNCLVQVASYPGLLAPAFVACSTNAGEGLHGKTESRGMTYLNVWRSGTFLLYSCKAAF